MNTSTALLRALGGALAGLSLAAPAAAQCGAVKLEGGSAAAGDALGARVALSDTSALVGAPSDDAAAPDAGAVLALRLVSGVWQPGPVLVSPDAAPGRAFGDALALDGARGLVGAPAWTALDGHPGAAYVLADGPAGWSIAAALAPAEPQAEQRFGAAVALCGDTALVGAPADGALGASAGAAFVFERGPAGWLQGEKLVAPGGLPFHRFGRAVALDGDTALVASLGGGPVEFAGAVHVFQRTPHGWVHVDALFLADAWPGDELGAALALDGDRALLGAPGRSMTFYESGAAFVFERVAGAWTQTATLAAGSSYLPFDHDHLGASVALDGDLALAGGPGFDGGEGAVLAWRLVGPSWQTDGKWKAYDAPAGEAFGAAVGCAGLAVLVGAPGDDAAAPDAGAAYVAELPPGGCPSLYGSPDELPLATGGTQHLTLAPGLGHAMHTWILLGSLSGTAPGIAGPGGLVLPLNPDAYLTHTLLHPNTPPLATSISSFGYASTDTAAFELPPGLPPALAGAVVHHAYVVLDPWTAAFVFASDPAPVALR